MDDTTNAEIEAILGEAIRPFFGDPMDQETCDRIEAAVRETGLPVDAVEFDLMRGDIRTRLADGREFRYGDIANFVGAPAKDPFPDDVADPDGDWD